MRVGELLAATRLLTLTGAGGCGKTRLAQQAAAAHAERFPAGVWWVELAAVVDGGPAGDTLARILGLSPDGRPTVELITEHLADAAPTLLVLDNCEHLVDDVAELTESLLRRTDVRVLATSRRPLGVGGETTWRVPSMEVPPLGCDLDRLRDADASRLVLDRLRQARPDAMPTSAESDLVVQLCHRLDGIPLALELASARARAMSLARVVDQLDDRFRLLRGGPRTVPRHRTLLASVQWSYDLLDDEERVLLRRLAVFQGGVHPEAAEVVAGFAPLSRDGVLDVLTRLVDQSLVVFDVARDRYRLLETIRDFARHHLDAERETELVADRHLTWARDVVESHADAVARADVAALAAVEQELPDLRTALDRAARGPDGESGLRLAAGLAFFWAQRGLGVEGAGRTGRVLDAHPAAAGVLRARALAAAAYDAFYGGDFAAAAALAEQGLAVAVGADDLQSRARCRHVQGIGDLLVDPARGRRALVESVELARACGDLWCETDALQLLGFSHLVQHRPALAHEALLASAAMAESSGNAFQLAWHQLACYLVAASDGELAAAAVAARRGADAGQRIGDPTIELWGRAGQLVLALVRGRYDELEDIAGQAVPSDRPPASIIEGFVAGVRRGADVGRDPGDALEALGEVADLLSTTFVPHDGVRLGLTVAAAWLAHGHPERAEVAAQVALERARGLESALVGPAQVVLAQLRRRHGDPLRADRLAHDGLAEIQDAGLIVDVPDALEAVAGTALDLGATVVATRLLGAADALREQLDLPGALLVITAADRAAALDALGEQFHVHRQEGRSMDPHAAMAYARRSRGERKRPSAGWAALTPTELDVARLAARGLTNPDIGRELFIARGTVKTHLEHVYAKLGLHGRTELAAALARRAAGSERGPS